MDIRNEYVRGSMKVAPMTEKMRKHRLTWYGHDGWMVRRDDTKIMMSMI